MRDPIIDEVRRIRRLIEEENGNDWKLLGQYFKTRQTERKSRPVAYKPKTLPNRGVA